MAHFFLPSVIGFTSPYLIILLPIISLPASPKPIESKNPIFIIAFSIIFVSKFSSSNYYSLAHFGFFAILLTLSIILSIGLKARSLASLLKIIAPNVRQKQIKIVLPILKAASDFYLSRIFIAA